MSTLIEAMKNTPQGKQSVWEHGLSVQDYTMDLIDHLNISIPLRHEWRIPKWVYDNKEAILKGMGTLRDIRDYTLFHDCGKPSCYTKDEKG